MEHDFIYRKQTQYHNWLRSSVLKEEAAITVQVDYAQNFTFVVQNAVQSFHWSSKQATIVPFVVHWYDTKSREHRYKTYCVISDEIAHDADTFYAFLSEVIPLIKKDFAEMNLRKIYYISEGAGGQFKNTKNLANLIMHVQVFGLEAEWSFTATSHGKSTCDAISAVVKCCTRRESLKPNIYITTPLDMYLFCRDSLTKDTLTFIYVTKEQVEGQRQSLRERYKNFKKLQGIRKHHVFQPRSENIIRMVRASNASVFVDVDFKKGETLQFSEDNLRIGKYYAFHEAGDYHIGILREIDTAEGDSYFEIMRITNRRTGRAKWPEPLQLINVAFREILLGIEDPIAEGENSFIFQKEAVSAIRSTYQKFKTNKKIM